MDNDNILVPITLAEAKAIVDTLPYPRVTEASITAKIDNALYWQPDHRTICVLTMRNGFTVIGFSAPADPRNYDRDVGQRYAYDNAFKQLWQLEGYLLRETLSQQENNG